MLRKRTLSRFKLFPSLVQLTYSIGGSAWTGQTMSPSMPAGRYVSLGILDTRAGSKTETKVVAISYMKQLRDKIALFSMAD